ncbi:hypothetical protein AAG570_006442 [Ranatra chinensis]|uniref:Calponin-homology (CH) domain-containing protein n=1 Tax=Ranatra chinensis TaxID=642074 RepID=A0ABD0YTZ9_9HEMI
MTSLASTSDKKKVDGGARSTLLRWVSTALPKDIGLEVKDFGRSWRDGLAFLAIVDSIKKGLVDAQALRGATNRYRLETAFNLAETELGIARLLDPEDVDVDQPDEKSVMTYVAQFLHKYPELRSESGDKLSAIQADYTLLRSWLIDRTQFLSSSLNQLSSNYQEYSAFESDIAVKSEIYHKLQKLVDSRSSISIATESWKEIELLWRKLQAQMRHWLWLIDSQLPPPFCRVGEWLYAAENLIENDDIPTVMNEETAGIISRKLEEHKAFFADLPKIEAEFQSGWIKLSDFEGRVSQHQIETMGQRLAQIGPRAAISRITLKFLEHKCCLIAFMELTENKVRNWTVKYGTESKVQQLLDQYNNFVSRNKIFQEFNRAYIDMQQVVDEYKRDGKIDQKECAAIDKFMRHTAERWKSVCMELRCVQSMLEEVVSYWRRWTSYAQLIEEWLAKAEMSLALDEESRIEFFQDIGVWKEKHDLLGDTVSFLIATCEDQVAKQLKDRYLTITSRWERIFSDVKQYMHAGEMIRHRKEYRISLEKLQTWLRNAEAILSVSNLNTSDKINAHVKELQFFSECLVKIRALLAMQLQLLNNVLVQQQSLEVSQREITEWLDNAEKLIRTLNLLGGRENILIQIEKHKVCYQ